jgi:hypothetical protein
MVGDKGPTVCRRPILPGSDARFFVFSSQLTTAANIPIFRSNTSRGEYRYADYGTFHGHCVSAQFRRYNSWDTSLRTHNATIGIAYKVGGPR